MLTHRRELVYVMTPSADLITVTRWSCACVTPGSAAPGMRPPDGSP